MNQHASGREQRKHPRFPCNILVHLDAVNQSGVGVITDLSRGGVGLTCRLSHRVAGMVRVSAFNSNPMANLNSAFGRVAWQHHNEDSGQMTVGLHLDLKKDWLEQALASDASGPNWECPQERLDIALGY
jgi:PilZ domain-containing protein